MAQVLTHSVNTTGTGRITPQRSRTGTPNRSPHLSPRASVAASPGASRHGTPERARDESSSEAHDAMPERLAPLALAAPSFFQSSQPSFAQQASFAQQLSSLAGPKSFAFGALARSKFPSGKDDESAPGTPIATVCAKDSCPAPWSKPDAEDTPQVASDPVTPLFTLDQATPLSGSSELSALESPAVSRSPAKTTSTQPKRLQPFSTASSKNYQALNPGRPSVTTAATASTASVARRVSKKKLDTVNSASPSISPSTSVDAPNTHAPMTPSGDEPLRAKKSTTPADQRQSKLLTTHSSGQLLRASARTRKVVLGRKHAPGGTSLLATPSSTHDAVESTPKSANPLAHIAGPLKAILTSPAALIGKLAGPFRWLCTAPVKVLFETLTGMKLLGLPINAEVLCLLVGCTFVVYNADRLHDAKQEAEQATRGDRATFFTKHNMIITGATVAAGVLAAVSLVRLPTMPLQILIPALALCTTYSAPVLGGGRSLKQLPGVKTPFLGAMWTLGSTLLPYLSLGASAAAATGASAIPLPFALAFAFFNTCCMSAFVDMRDIEGDKMEGTPTIPVSLGMKGCKQLIGGVCLLNSALCIAVGRPEMVLAPIFIAARCALYKPGQAFMSEFCMAAPALAFASACL